MKKYLCYLIIFFFATPLSASIDFNIEKVNTSAKCQSFFSNATMLVEEPYMYALTSYGLEIYEIQDGGSLHVLSQLPLQKSRRFVKKDNFIYVGSHEMIDPVVFDPYQLYISQINVNDPYNPEITNTLEFDNSYRSMIPVLMGDYFIARAYWGPDAIYTIPDLNYYGTLPDEDMWLKTINDTICINWTNEPSVIDLYNTANILNFQYITTMDLSSYHGDYGVQSFMTINDTILCVSGFSAVSFWNIEDVTQWEYIGHYESSYYIDNATNLAISESYMVLTQRDGLALVDISDMSNPCCIDFVNYAYYNIRCIVHYNEKFYVATSYDGIDIYKIESYELALVEDFYEYPAFYGSHLFYNKLFIQTWHDGIYVFDITNPLHPTEVVTCLKDMPFKTLHGHDHLLVVKDYEELNIKIYDLCDPTNPVLRNTIDGLLINDWNYSLVRFDEVEPNALYLCNVLDGKIRKYDIAEMGNPTLMFTYNEIPQMCSFDIKDGLGYLLTTDTHPQKLYLIDGLCNNNPNIVNTLNNFSNYTYSPGIQICGDYLCMRYSSEYDETKFYSLDEPNDPQFLFKLEIPSTNSWPEIYDNLIFSKTNNVGFVYDLNESKNDTLHYIDYFPGLFWMYDYKFYDVGNTHYLFVTEQSSIGVYEFNYSYGIDDEPDVSEEPFASYPNPFSTSTTISLSLTPRLLYATPRQANLHELTQIKIYNVKGQLVRELSAFPNGGLGTSSVVWDGKDENRNDVKSGVYFYKISGEDEHIGKVVKLK